MSVVPPEILSVASNHGDVSSVSTVHETETPPGISASNTSVVETNQVELKVAKSEARKVCFRFQRGGNCRFGIDCKYEHDESSVRNFIKTTHIGGQKSKVCYSFAKSGKCRFEENCRFSHQVADKGVHEEPQDHPQVSEESKQPGDPTKEPLQHNSQEEKKELKKSKSQPKVCKFFQQGSCRKGKSCRFRHPKDEEGESAEGEPHPQEDEKREAGAGRPAQKSVIQIQTYLRLSELTDDDLQKLRSQEVQQLKKRFPDLLEMENEGQPSVYRVVVHPSDPDWPYSVQDFQLNVTFPKSYPAEPMQVGLPEDQEIPAVVLRHIEAGAQEWILAKHEMNKLAGRVELTFRPFLRWFDRNLESQFTEGARKLKREVDLERAGFEFVTFEKDSSKKEEPIQPSLPKGAIIISKPRGQKSDEEDEYLDSRKLPVSMSEMQVNSEEEEEEEVEGERSSSDDDKDASKYGNIAYDPPDKDMRGTEILFQGLKINKSTASLAVTNLTVIIQCSRCKNHVDVTTPPRRNNLITCLKCNNRQIMTYRPCLVHAYSHVIGFLDLDGCLPFDVNLVTSTLVVSCLSCSHDNKLKGIQYGQVRNMWCEKCHQKMTIEAESCRFQRLQPSENIGSGPLHTVKVKGPKKQQKDPAIVDLMPLPDNGTCKHYKKSFRWLRFPCCGKFYPCDECHDLDNDDGHEMKYATRMLCGFCAKEQPYSADKPCVRCGSATTKGRTQHWEGGTGCRNKVKMSRNDKQKYAGIAKTVSRKAQNTDSQKKGK